VKLDHLDRICGRAGTEKLEKNDSKPYVFPEGETKVKSKLFNNAFVVTP
jgi:hypothetical protein